MQTFLALTRILRTDLSGGIFSKLNLQPFHIQRSVNQCHNFKLNDFYLSNLFVSFRLS